MISSRHLHLNPKDANFLFEYDDKVNKTKIILTGFAEQASFITERKFVLCVTAVAEEHEYNIVNIPDILDQSKTEDRLCCGQAILVEPDNNVVKEEFVEISLLLKPKEFEKLKYFTDKSFFSSNATMTISLSVVGMELGYVLLLDKFPPGKYLPVVGYYFSISKTSISD